VSDSGVFGDIHTLYVLGNGKDALSFPHGRYHCQHQLWGANELEACNDDDAGDVLYITPITVKMMSCEMTRKAK
jgi:hypothetical protein